MEKERRNNLRRVIHECRKLLEDEISKRLAYYGVMADGSFLDLAKLPHLTAEGWRTRQRIEQAIEKEMLGKLTKSEAVKRHIHHVAFTYLNRFAALRAMEVRGLLKKETIIRRDEYGGRSLRERDIAESNPHLAPEPALKESLIQAFDEVGEEIKVLFDMNSEYSLVFPETRACLELIRLLTEDVTEDDWRQDDVIGWIYQYFNSGARKEFRKERRKPRADDIPVINQFYTPDWIVKALIDNTLGRLWLEMHPDSKIKEFCTYFVPLKDKPHVREIKPVRDIRVLDPACGSGHFLVYAFDLLYQMYLEDEPEIQLPEIPVIILENNLFGVDIDLRSVQLAALSLYLKAKTYNRSLKIRGINLVCADARIADSEQRLEFLKRFRDDPTLQHIFARLFEELEYTYEIGSLLKIRIPFERLFQERVSEKGRQARLSLPVTGQAKFGAKGLVGQTKFALNRSAESSEGMLTLVIPKERTIEEMLEELRSFERESIDVQDMGRLLFATEAEKSVGLLALLSRKYDVVLMNPPYGAMPGKTKDYLREHYPKTHFDYYAAFMEQAVDLTEPGGYVGALTGRTFMFLKSYRWVREELLGKNAYTRVLFDLGFGVLDEATARWAAFAAQKSRKPRKPLEDDVILFLKLTEIPSEAERIHNLETALASLQQKASSAISHFSAIKDLERVPGTPYSYLCPSPLRELFSKFSPLDRDIAGKPNRRKIAYVKRGLATADDARFIRHFWEVPRKTIANSSNETFHGRKWVPFAKGSSRFYADLPLLINWNDNGKEVKAFPNSVIRNEPFYFREGMTWANIVSSPWLDIRILPKGCIFGHAADSIFPLSYDYYWHLLAYGNSTLAAFLFLVLDPLAHNRTGGYMCHLPISDDLLKNAKLAKLAQEAYAILRELNVGDEISTLFIKPWLLQVSSDFNSKERPITAHPFAESYKWASTCAWPSLKEIRSIKGLRSDPLRHLAELCVKREEKISKKLAEIQEAIDAEIYDIYQISEENRNLMERELARRERDTNGPKKEEETNQEPENLEERIRNHVARLISFYVKQTIESDKDGIVPLDEIFKDNLVQKIRNLVVKDFGIAQVERVEQELYQILGMDLKDWLAQRYFDFHVSLYMNRPIFWQLASYKHGRSRGPPGVFSCFVHYDRLTRDTIPKIRAFYLERVKEALTREKEHLSRVLEAARATHDGPRIDRLSKVYEGTKSKIDELERFEAALLTVHDPKKDQKALPRKAKWVDRAIAEVRDNGWAPIIDYGVRVNIEPLKEASLLHPAADRVK